MSSYEHSPTKRQRHIPSRTPISFLLFLMYTRDVTSHYDTNKKITDDNDYDTTL